VIQDGVDLVARFEGYSATPYKCPAGVWTIGYGTTRYPWGRRVTAGEKPCTKAQAEKWLSIELSKAEQSVARLTTPYLNEYRRAALASFVYNLGAGAFRASTLRRRINSGDWDDVPYQLSRWNKAGGRILKGLALRRAAEAQLWLWGMEAI
jgi:lysozyme